jgi:hypothetical protein
MTRLSVPNKAAPQIAPEQRKPRGVEQVLVAADNEL